MLSKISYRSASLFSSLISALFANALFFSFFWHSITKDVWIAIIVFVVSIVFSFLISKWLARGAIKRIRSVVLWLHKIESGELDFVLSSHQSKAVDKILGSVVHIAEKIKTLLHKVSKMENTTRCISEKMESISERHEETMETMYRFIQDITDSDMEQNASIEQASSIVEETSMTLQEISQNTQRVSELSQHVSQSAEAGNEIIQKSVAQVGEMTRNIEELAAIITDLQQQSEKITDITNLITNISSQTNLLALNAAIEAARAGEHGRGFAVVADSVKKLAEESNRSAQDIRRMIQSIHEKTFIAVKSVEENKKSMLEGKKMSEEAGETFINIQNSVLQVTENIHSVSVALQQIAQGSEEMVHSMTEIANVSLQNTSKTQNVTNMIQGQKENVAELKTLSHEMSDFAKEIKEIVEFYH